MVSLLAHWPLFLLLLGMLALPVMAQGGRAACDMWNRCTWLIFGCGVALTLGMWSVNPSAALAFGMIVTGALTVAPWEQAFPRSLYPAYAAGIAWLVLAPQMQSDYVRPVLVGFVLTGCWFGAWAVFSNWQGQRPYQVTWGRGFGWLPRPLFCWHEDSPTHLKAGQGNSNHLQSMAVLCIASCVGVALFWSSWILLALPLLMFPLLLRVNKEGVFSQAHIHLLSTLVAVAAVVSASGRLAWLILSGYVLLGVLVAKPWRSENRGWDGRRFQLWNLALREIWWPMGWRRRLIGVGTATWEPLTAPITMQKISGVVFTTAHNEYVQFLVEHGILGLACLGLYLMTTLVRLWQGGPEGQALFIVAVALCSIASANFPWSWFHEIPQPPTCLGCQKMALPPGVVAPDTHCRCSEPRQLGPSQPLYVGSPGLLAMSLVLAILVEGIQ